MLKILFVITLLLSGCQVNQAMTKDEILPYIQDTYNVNENGHMIEKEYDSIYVSLYNDSYSIFVKDNSQKYKEVIIGKLTTGVKKENVEGYDIYISLNKEAYYAYELYNNCDVSKGTIDQLTPFIVITAEGGEISWMN